MQLIGIFVIAWPVFALLAIVFFSVILSKHHFGKIDYSRSLAIAATGATIVAPVAGYGVEGFGIFVPWYFAIFIAKNINFASPLYQFCIWMTIFCGAFLISCISAKLKAWYSYDETKENDEYEM